MDVTRAVAGLMALVACSGRKPMTVDDARRPPPADAAPPHDAPAGAYRVEPGASAGDVQVRVEWRDVPQELRAPGGMTPCGTPGPPALAPTTTWGIPEAFVAIDVDHGAPFVPPAARIVLDGCALAPRAVVAGKTLEVASHLEHPAAVSLDDPSGARRVIQLPVAGHAVEIPLVPGATTTLSAEGAEPASVFAAASPYVAVTDATGQVVLRGVPVGTHPVRAWLPRRGALAPRAATGSVTVVAGGLVELTLDVGTR